MLFQRSGLDRLLNERVRFTLSPSAGDQTFEGVLVGSYKDSVELANPALIDGEVENPVKGPLGFLHQQIAFWQRVS